jgi:hypothetical protein
MYIYYPQDLSKTMPWQPFRRKIKHKQLTNEELETSFDDVLPRSVSDGNLVR